MSFTKFGNLLAHFCASDAPSSVEMERVSTHPVGNFHNRSFIARAPLSNHGNHGGTGSGQVLSFPVFPVVKWENLVQTSF
jgi:hypothetical protein